MGATTKQKNRHVEVLSRAPTSSDMGARVTVSGDLLSGKNNVTATANHGKQHSLTHYEASKWFD
jgi:hypothetical protein